MHDLIAFSRERKNKYTKPIMHQSPTQYASKRTISAQEIVQYKGVIGAKCQINCSRRRQHGIKYQ